MGRTEDGGGFSFDESLPKDQYDALVASGLIDAPAPLAQSHNPPQRLKKSPQKEPTKDRLPPHSVEMEMGLLGSILHDPKNGIIECIDRLGTEVESFYDVRHQEIYRVLIEMHESNLPIDLITLFQKIKERYPEKPVDIEYLNKIQDSSPSAANLGYYLDIVKDKHSLRRLIQYCNDICRRAFEHSGTTDSLMDSAESDLTKISQARTEAIRTLNGKSLGKRMLDDLERRSELKGKLSGLDTGLADINYWTNGLQYGEQCIVGARPSQGKTALGLSILRHVVFEQRIPALFISLEMDVEAVMRRLLSMHMKIPMRTVREGTYSDSDYGKMVSFHGLCAKAPLYVIDAVHGMGIHELCAKARRHVIQFGVKFIVTDYLQKIKPKERHEKRTYEIGDISGRLKALASETKTAMLTLAQLNRENEKQKGREPRLSDLSDSGQIERDADTVFLIHRKQYETKLILAKQRDGETGVITLFFDGKYTRFENAQHEDNE